MSVPSTAGEASIAPRPQTVNPLDILRSSLPPRPSSAPTLSKKDAKEKKSPASRGVTATAKPLKSKSNTVGKTIARLEKKNTFEAPRDLPPSLASGLSKHDMASSSNAREGTLTIDQPASPLHIMSTNDDALEDGERNTKRHKESDTKEMHIDDGASDIAPIFRSVSQVLEENSEAIGEDLTLADPKEVLRGAFAPTPQKRTPSVPHAPCDTLDAPSPPAASFSNPITFLKDPTFRPVGVVPNGFPEARDLNKDAQAGKIPVKGQSRFSKIDVLCPALLFYHDTTPLPPTSLLAALNPPHKSSYTGMEFSTPASLDLFRSRSYPPWSGINLPD